MDGELDELLPSLAAISLEGAKGVGKTETAKARANSIYRLDDPATAALLDADPQRALAQREPILFDEWQRLPPTWDLVRRAVDDDPRPARFLLTGSAGPKTPATHSGAGRVVRVPMRPLSLAERGMPASVSIAACLAGSEPGIVGHTDIGLADYVTEILASGFPGLRHLSGRALRAALDGYLARIVDTDFPEMGLTVRNPVALRSWLVAYAAATGTPTSYEQLRDAATSGRADKPAKTTTGPYRETLRRLWIADPLPAWSPSRNHLKRLGAAPKHHLVDPALAATLLHFDADALLSRHAPALAVPRDGTLLGGLFESLVAQSLRVYAQGAEASVSHLRTHRGEHEIDFILQRRDGRVVAVEVKLARTVNDSDVKHLHWLAGEIKDDLVDAIIITTGTDAYRRKDGIAVVPAALLGP